MELLQLKYFQAVAINQHITHSAEKFHISQPALSGAISRLEHELGVTLFTRTGRNIILNEYGKIFFKRVNRILIEIDNAKKELGDMKDHRDQLISLSVTSPQLLQGVDEFIKNNPEIKWKQTVRSVPEIIDLMHNGEIDISISSPGYYGDEFESIVLYHDEFMIAVHPDHPLANEKSVFLRDIAQEKFILLHKRFPFRSLTDKIFSDAGLKPNVIMECDHIIRQSLINANVGITISTRSAKYRNLYDENTCFIRIDDIEQSRDVVLTWRKDRYLNKPTKLFCDFLIKHYKEMPNL